MTKFINFNIEYGNDSVQKFFILLRPSSYPVHNLLCIRACYCPPKDKVFPAYVIKAYREIRGIAPFNFNLWVDNIKMDLREVGWGMGWINLAQDMDKWRALVIAVMNLRVP